MFGKWQLQDDELTDFIRIEYRNLNINEDFDNRIEENFMSAIKVEFLSILKSSKDKEKGQFR